MVGIYLSGTGNTKHCVTYLCQLLSIKEVRAIEEKGIIDFIKENDEIILGCPTQFSNMPYMISEFIDINKNLWKNKKIFLVVTMGAFAGDVTGCLKRKLEKYGALVLGGLQIKMPDSVTDSKLLKKSYEENVKIIKKADQRIEEVACLIKKKDYPQEGLSAFDHFKGLFGQRLYFKNKTSHYSTKLKVSSSCIGCGKCVGLCPMHNLVLKEGRVHSLNRCTMCYRCIVNCPTCSMTLLGKEIVEQVKYEKFISQGK